MRFFVKKMMKLEQAGMIVKIPRMIVRGKEGQ